MDDATRTDEVQQYELATCRHCGHVIARARGGWAHLTLWLRGHGFDQTYGASFLNRCQADVPRYGYDAMPNTGVPCGCYMCALHGEQIGRQL